MLLPVFAAMAVAIVFYLLLPVAGAFRVRAQWRRFRKRLRDLSLRPILTYGDYGAGPPSSKEGRDIGVFRFYGKIEAIEGTHRIWARSEGASALVDLSRAPIYVLGSVEGDAGELERLSWKSVQSLAEGTRVFAAGLVRVDPLPVFEDRPDEPLIVVCHDSGEGELLSRLVASARRSNEYWNPATRASLALGLILQSALLLLVSRSSYLSSVRALAFLAAIAPVLPLAPPGLAFFLAYRALWRWGLSLRMARDLIEWPLRYFRGDRERGGKVEAGREGWAEAALPDGGSYVKRVVAGEEEPPEGISILELPQVPLFPRLVRGRITLFEPAASRDPAAERVAAMGDPEELALLADRRSMVSTVLAGLCFALSVALNYVVGFLLWRFLPL